MFVPASAYGHIIGPLGVNVKRYKSELDVKIKLANQGELARCEVYLTGPILAFPDN